MVLLLIFSTQNLKIKPILTSSTAWLSLLTLFLFPRPSFLPWHPICLALLAHLEKHRVSSLSTGLTPRSSARWLPATETKSERLGWVTSTTGSTPLPTLATSSLLLVFVLFFHFKQNYICYFRQYKHWFFSNLVLFDWGRWIQLADQWVVSFGRGKGWRWLFLDPTQLDEDMRMKLPLITVVRKSKIQICKNFPFSWKQQGVEVLTGRAARCHSM